MRMVQWGCLLSCAVLSEDLIPFQSVETSLTWHAKKKYTFFVTVVLKDCDFVTPVSALLFSFLTLLHVSLDIAGFFSTQCSMRGVCTRGAYSSLWCPAKHQQWAGGMQVGDVSLLGIHSHTELPSSITRASWGKQEAFWLEMPPVVCPCLCLKRFWLILYK